MGSRSRRRGALGAGGGRAGQGRGRRRGIPRFLPRPLHFRAGHPFLAQRIIRLLLKIKPFSANPLPVAHLGVHSGLIAFPDRLRLAGTHPAPINLSFLGLKRAFGRIVPINIQVHHHPGAGRLIPQAQGFLGLGGRLLPRPLPDGGIARQIGKKSRRAQRIVRPRRGLSTRSPRRQGRQQARPPEGCV